MNLHFVIHYRTLWGENLSVTAILNDKAVPETDREQEIRLQTDDGYIWKEQLEIDASVRKVSYRYAVVCGDQEVRREPDAFIHEWTPSGKDEGSIMLYDLWHDALHPSYLESSALKCCVFAPAVTYKSVSTGEPVLELTTSAVLPKNRILGICGSIPALGAWNPEKCVRMRQNASYQWTAQMDVRLLEAHFDYKFVLLNADDYRISEWEAGANRSFNVPDTPCSIIKVECSPARISSMHWRGAGVVIPLFSLRSKDSFGVGDFGDLQKMVDWSASVRMSAIQLLPINDTTQSHTWRDSYPYNAISAFALHPMYLDLKKLGKLKDAAKMKSFLHAREELNALPHVDYERVNRAKMEYVTLYFAESGHEELSSAPYLRFYAANKDWLVPYALFSHFRDTYQTSDFSCWPEEWRTFDPVKAGQLALADKEVADKLSFYYYVQYKLYSQMAEVRDYARSKGIILKGDIPIGISRNSVAAWVDGRYLHFDGQAGAPPDDFAVDGQNWGFPTYDWDAMLADGCAWWKRRLTYMSEFFDAYRIDHVLGFFRIWEIPYGYISGLMGHFSPAKPLSVEEIEAAGLSFDEARFTQPHIQSSYLSKLFGADYAAKVGKFLVEKDKDNWEFRAAFDNQQKLRAYFAENAGEQELYAPLCTLLCNRLFIEDPRISGYHPRIAVQKSEVFQTLSPREQYSFNCLYDDFYYSRHNQFWYDEAMKKLPLIIHATEMLPCAEDLGMVPDCVKWVLDRLQILSLEIQRMPKEYGVSFGRTENYPYLSVATIATHDMPPLRLWWKQQNEETKALFCHNVLRRSEMAPADLSAELCEINVRQHLESPSMLCLLALQDWLSISDALKAEKVEEEQINVPSNPDQYWRYRMHLTIEDLVYHSAFNEKVRNMIVQSGRTPDKHTPL